MLDVIDVAAVCGSAALVVFLYPVLGCVRRGGKRGKGRRRVPGGVAGDDDVNLLSVTPNLPSHLANPPLGDPRTVEGRIARGWSAQPATYIDQFANYQSAHQSYQGAAPTERGVYLDGVGGYSPPPPPAGTSADMGWGASGATELYYDESVPAARSQTEDGAAAALANLNYTSNGTPPPSSSSSSPPSAACPSGTLYHEQHHGQVPGRFPSGCRPLCRPLGIYFPSRRAAIA